MEAQRWDNVKKHEPFRLLCQNITRYGPMLKDFVKSHGEYHGYALGEHHLPPKGCEEEEAAMSKMGMRSVWKPGQANDKGPGERGPRKRRRHLEAARSRDLALGGTCVLARARIATRKIPGWDEAGCEIEDLTGLIWPLKGQQVAVFSGYLRPGVGTGGRMRPGWRSGRST